VYIGGDFVLNRLTFETAALDRLGVHYVWMVDDARALSRRDLHDLDIVRPARGLALVTQVLRLFREKHVKVVLCHVGAHPRRTLVTAALARLTGRRVVVELVGIETRGFAQRRFKSRLFMRWLLALSQRVFFHHADLEELIRRHRLIPLDRTHRIPVGTHVPPEPAPIHDGETGIVLYLNRLVAHKLPWILAQAAPRILAGMPRARIRFVGTGGGYAEEQRTMAVATELGLTDRIEFVPFVREAEREIRSAALFVYPSAIGDLNNAMLEAMAHGIPVVASRVPHMERVVEHGVSGVLVEGTDPDTWAETILALLRDPERRRRLGEGGRARIAAAYSIDAAMAVKADLLRSLAGIRDDEERSR
jgi:glycosyltransferase involved in cell wall biosynthesis